MPSTAFGPLGDSAVLALTQASQTVALGTLPNDGPALRLQSLNSGQTAWYVKFGTSGAVTVSVTDGMRVVPGGQDAPVIVPVPTGSTHYAILCEGSSGNVLASYGGYDEATFSPVGASQVVAVTTTDQRIALPTLGTISPAIRLVATSPSVLSLWVKLGNAAVTGGVTTSMKVSPGSVEDPTVIPVTSGETHLSIFCEGVDGSVVLSPGQLDHSLPFPLSRSGDRWGVMPFVGTDGVMEIGRIIDFHNSDADTSDFSIRVRADDIGAGTDLSLTPSAGADAGVKKRIMTVIDSTLAQGDVFYYNGANVVRLAPGVSGYPLKTFGAAANPAWAAEGLRWVSSGSLSNVTTLDIPVPAQCNGFEIELQNWRPVTDNTELWLRFSQSGSFLSGASDYAWSNFKGGNGNTADAADNEITLSSVWGNVAAELGSLIVRVLDISTASVPKSATWHGYYTDTAGNPQALLGGGRLILNNNTIDGMRLLFSSGNISTGNYVFRAYSNA